MKAYSMDLGERVLADCDAGLGTTAVARKYSVSPSWVRRLKQHRRERGDLRPRTGGSSKERKINRQRLKELATQQPDATLVELRDRLGVKVTPWAIGKALRELGLTFKKVVAGRGAGSARRGPAPGRLAGETTGPGPAKAGVHRRNRSPNQYDPLARLGPPRPATGREGAAWPLDDHHPDRCVGSAGMRTALTVAGAVNGETFQAFVRRVLTPTLRPGDLVVMDNLATHKVAGVREAVSAAQAEVVYLPPYSPDLNPIENAFRKIKQGLRSARHRTRETLWNDTPRILETITPSDAAGYFRHSGYALQVK